MSFVVSLPPSSPFVNTKYTDMNRYDLKQMLVKSPILRVPEELHKHVAIQFKPNRQARKTDDTSFRSKSSW